MHILYLVDIVQIFFISCEHFIKNKVFLKMFYLKVDLKRVHEKDFPRIPYARIHTSSKRYLWFQ